MPTADIILQNANVITMEPGQPRAEAVAINGDRILLVASGEEVEQLRGARTRVIDCQGKTVVPGFNDAHCHIFSFVRKLLSLDLSPASVGSIGDIKAVIRRQVENTPSGEWITGTDYNEFYLAEKRHPNRWDLDEVAPHHPVFLTHRSLHACVLNSRALSLAGITAETLEPPGGIMDRDLNTGEPNGVLFEMVGYLRERVLPPLSEAEIRKGISLVSQHYLSLGLTSVQDATVVNDVGRWRTISQLKKAGELKSRVSMMFGIEALPEFQERGLTFGSGDSQLSLGAIKIMLHEATGEQQPAQSELNSRVADAHQAGFQVAIHAIEQGSVEAAIIALENNRGQFGSGRRHRIEHCSQCPPGLLERLRRLEAVVVTQPPFLYYSGERYLATLPAGQLKWLYRIGAFHRSGLVVAGSSDSPVVSANPLVGMYAAVTRLAESGQQILPQEGVSPAEALAMYTTNGAYASFEEAIKGSLASGKLADMVLLSGDPVKSPLESMMDIRVEMTIIGGKVVWET